MTGGEAFRPAPTVAPHALQNREPSGGVAPQLAQMTASFAPQPLQKIDPAGGSYPQWEQVTFPDPTAHA
ncbi:MAG TPA: hypothetical protein VGK30_07140 [Candidatus Binatia bacterium]